MPGRVLDCIRTTPSLDITTMVPFQVGNSDEPEVMSRTELWPSRTTVILCVLASTVETWDRPIVKGSSRSTPP